MKDMGEVRYFLRIEVDRQANRIFLSQKKYVLGLVAEYGMKQCRTLGLPINTHSKLTTEADETPLPN